MEWSIQQVARLAGTTARALRHYGDLGLVPASRIGSNGYRYYDEAALQRLQRVLLMRELGLSLAQVGEILSRQRDETVALEGHLEVLRQQQDQIGRQIEAVGHAIRVQKEKETIVAEKMFDGFNHAQYREEVEQRWGEEAAEASDRWWKGLGRESKESFQQRVELLNREWITVANTPGSAPESAEAQRVASMHIEWLRSVPGTPAAEGTGVGEYVRSLAEMYVADPRFSVNYGGVEGARFVRDALLAWLERDTEEE